MSCENVRRWLEFDDADETDALRVGEHLERCVDCQAFAAMSDPATSLPASSLSDDITPPADLWPQIEAKIQAERVVRPNFAAAKRPGRDWQQAASIITTVAAVVFLAVVIRSTVAPVATESMARFDEPNVESELAAAIEQECRGVMRELSLAPGLGVVDPRTVALEAEAREVELAIADTRLAIERDGEEPKMMASLARLCRVRLRLTEHAQELARS